MRLPGSQAFQAVSPDVLADRGQAESVSQRVRPVACQAGLQLREASLLRARAACPAVPWLRRDARHQDVRRVDVRRALVPRLRALQVRPASQPRAVCRGALPERRHPVLLPAPVSAGCAQALRRAVASPDVAVSQRAAAESAWGVRELRPAVAPQASLRVARGERAPRPAAALRGALQAVRAVPELRAASDARGRPRAAEAERGAPVRQQAEPAASGVQEPQQEAPVVASDVRVLRPAAEQDARAARRRAVAPADAARLPAVPDARVRPARAAPSAFRQARFLPWAAPARRPAARFVRATLKWRTASPSAQSWQAARDEALSWSLESPAEKSGQEGNREPNNSAAR